MRVHTILLTGVPGIGKTTVIQKVAKGLRDYLLKGFYTREIREGGMRKGFELVSFDRRTAILAHVDQDGPFRVSRYGVNLKAFDTFLSDLSLENFDTDLVIIDEIGKMECYSETFKRIVHRVLDSDIVLLATIGKRGNPYMEEIKKRDDVKLIEVTRQNRDRIPVEIETEIRSLLGECKE